MIARRLALYPDKALAMTELDAFLAARDGLLARRTDLDAAAAHFQWPALQHFDWASDYFDVIARGNEQRPVVGEAHARRELVGRDLVRLCPAQERLQRVRGGDSAAGSSPQSALAAAVLAAAAAAAALTPHAGCSCRAIAPAP